MKRSPMNPNYVCCYREDQVTVKDLREFKRPGSGWVSCIAATSVKPTSVGRPIVRIDAPQGAQYIERPSLLGE